MKVTAVNRRNAPAESCSYNTHQSPKEQAIVRYILTKNVLGRNVQIDITKDRYSQIEMSMKTLYEAFEIELLFDLSMQNHIEIDTYIASQLIQHSAFREPDNYGLRASTWEFIRRLNNWLASLSTWRDITEHRLIAIAGRGVEIADFRNRHIDRLENDFEYGFLYHLRNCSQHYSFPSSGLSFGGKRDEDRSKLNISSNLMFEYRHFRDYFERGGRGVKGRKKFGKILERKTRNGGLDISYAMRKGLHSHAKALDEVRESIDNTVSSAEQAVTACLDEYRLAHPDGNTIGLAAMEISEKGTANKSSIVQIFDDFLLHGQKLRKQNSGVALALHKKHVRIP